VKGVSIVKTEEMLQKAAGVVAERIAICSCALQMCVIVLRLARA
jgi:hypothetical protein